jgi:hypothetical protein
MAFIVEKDEGTAGRRFVPFHLFASTGTGPFTGGSNITMLASLNGAAQISLGSVSAVSANAGQYGFQLSASNVSTLGSLALYTDNVAHFAQHVATVQVVNYNPMSLQSGVIIAGGSYSSTTVRLDLVAYSGATVGAGNFAPGVYSGVSFSIRDSGIANSSFQAGTFSNLTVQGIANYANISNVTLAAGTHSNVTIQGISNYANISNVTLAAGTHSGATVQGVSNYANISNVTLHAGTHSNVTIQGVTRLNSNVTLNANTHSGATVEAVQFISTAGERSLASSFLSTSLGGTTARRVEEAFYVLRHRVQISGSTMTVYQGDDSTSAWTATVSTGTATIYQIDPGIA